MWIFSCKETGLRWKMENHSLRQPLSSSTFSLCGTVAVSYGRTLWQYQCALQVCWSVSIPSEPRPHGGAVNESEPGAGWLGYRHGRRGEWYENTLWTLGRFR